MNYETAERTLIKQLELRGMALKTQLAYRRYSFKFSVFTHKENDLTQVTIEDIQDFLHYRRYVENLTPQTINVCRAALKFFYTIVLDKEWNNTKVPSQKKIQKIPIVLSVEEVINLLNAIEDTAYKMISILMYSAGLRISEALKLKICDIDSKNMKISIHEAKGNKERYALLSEHCLESLREYYKAYRPTYYLFPGRGNHLYVTRDSVHNALRKAALKARITTSVTPHTLRHCFATHLLEKNTNIYYIKQLLGHSSLKSTSVYLQSISFSHMGVKSPLDLIGGLK